MGSRVLQGRYLLQHEIGAGSMGVVYLGVCLAEASSRRRVAIKRLRAGYAHDARLQARFVDEARLAGHVAHANVVATLEVVSEGGELFLVTEYVAGETVVVLLRAALGCVPAAVAVALTCDVLQGLHAIHEARGRDDEPLGLVHRDVSTHAIMAGLDGTAHLLGFGVARPVGDDDETRSEDTSSKLAYMAPESLLAGESTRRSDVYSAGLVLWELLTGRRFRVGASADDLIWQAHGCDVSPPSALAPGLPAGLDEVVLKACAREPAARYATALEMAAALEAACDVATRENVGAWVGRLAGEAIERRDTFDAHSTPTVRPDTPFGRETRRAPARGEAGLLEALASRASDAEMTVLLLSPSDVTEMPDGSLQPPSSRSVSRGGALLASEHAPRARALSGAPSNSRPPLHSTRNCAVAPPPMPQGGELVEASPLSMRQAMKAVARDASFEQTAPPRPVLGAPAPAAAPPVAAPIAVAPPETVIVREPKAMPESDEVAEPRPEIDSLAGLHVETDETQPPRSRASAAKQPSRARNAGGRLGQFTVATVALAAASILLGKVEQRSSARGGGGQGATMLIEAAPRREPVARAVVAPPAASPYAAPSAPQPALAVPAPSNSKRAPAAPASTANMSAVAPAEARSLGKRPPAGVAAGAKTLADCDPPVFVDKDGNRRLKPHCALRED